MEMHIAVIGLGKIGQPLAALFASRGYHVTGVDINQTVVESLNAGRTTIVNEPGLAGMIAEAVAHGNLKSTIDTSSAVASADVVLIVVPMLITEQRRPEYRVIDAAFNAVGATLRPGTLVLLETTVPVGDTRQRFARLLEESGLRCGRDFSLAFSPERVQSGHIFLDLATYPKVVGGVDEESGDRAEQFYREALRAPVIRLSSTEAAEFCKLAESVYRDVNIGLVNELALAAEQSGVDITEVISAANSEPQSHLHAPGIGVGGHCMPVYPYFFLADGLPHEIVVAGRVANEQMPAHAVQLLEDCIGDLEGRTILILGLAYRPGVKEAMLSPASELSAILRQRGVRALVHDPLFSSEEIRALGLEPSHLYADDADAVILQTFHPEYRDLDLGRLCRCQVVLDGRNALAPERVRAAGMRYLGIGRSSNAGQRLDVRRSTGTNAGTLSAWSTE